MFYSTSPQVSQDIYKNFLSASYDHSKNAINLNRKETHKMSK